MLLITYSNSLHLKTSTLNINFPIKIYVLKIIINIFLLYCLFFRIAKDIFIQAAREIVLAYPHEREGVYFVPGKPKTKYSPRTIHRGKLWSRYCNLKSKLGEFTEVEDESSITQGMYKTYIGNFHSENLIKSKDVIYLYQQIFNCL